MLKLPKFDKSRTLRANQGRVAQKLGGFTEEISCTAHRRFPLVRWHPPTHKLSLFITLPLIHPIFCHIPLSPNLPPEITLVGCNPMEALRKLGPAVYLLKLTETHCWLRWKWGQESHSRNILKTRPQFPCHLPESWVGEGPCCGDPIPVIFAHPNLT